MCDCRHLPSFPKLSSRLDSPHSWITLSCLFFLNLSQPSSLGPCPWAHRQAQIPVSCLPWLLLGLCFPSSLCSICSCCPSLLVSSPLYFWEATLVWFSHISQYPSASWEATGFLVSQRSRCSLWLPLGSLFPRRFSLTNRNHARLFRCHLWVDYPAVCIQSHLWIACLTSQINYLPSDYSQMIIDYSAVISDTEYLKWNCSSRHFSVICQCLA